MYLDAMEDLPREAAGGRLFRREGRFAFRQIGRISQ